MFYVLYFAIPENKFGELLIEGDGGALEEASEHSKVSVQWENAHMGLK